MSNPLAGYTPEQVAADAVRSTQERCHSRLWQVDNEVEMPELLGYVGEVDIEFLVTDIFRGLREAGFTITDTALLEALGSHDPQGLDHAR